MTGKQYKIQKNTHTGKWSYFHPTGLYSHKSAEELLPILINHLNSLYESREKLNDEYYDFSEEVAKEIEHLKKQI